VGEGEGEGWGEEGEGWGEEEGVGKEVRWKVGGGKGGLMK
jgi:hypothetical protein